MSDTKHTPGPWLIAEPKLKALYTDKDRLIRTQDGLHIAEVFMHQGPNNKDGQHTEANARLISQAPELLRACSLILTRLDAEARDKGEDASFLGAALRGTLREAIEAAQA